MKLFWTVVLIIIFLGRRIPDRPDHLQIIGQRWDVKYVRVVIDEESGLPLDGITLCEEHEIWISTDQKPREIADTLLHEELHAQTCVDGEIHNDWYNNSAHAEHPGIEFSAQRMLDFVQQNPEAVRWIEAQQ